MVLTIPAKYSSEMSVATWQNNRLYIELSMGQIFEGSVVISMRCDRDDVPLQTVTIERTSMIQLSALTMSVRNRKLVAKIQIFI